MRSFGLYFLAGLLAGVALNFVVPIAAADLASHGWSSPQRHIAPQGLEPVQAVNRAGKTDRIKTDRLMISPSRAIETRKAPLMEGCDAAFSPLNTAAARFNYASRCLS